MAAPYSDPNAHDGFERHPTGRDRNRRNARVFAAGDLKLLSLALIAEQPCHGYDLIRRIEKMFEGAYSPSPGVIYPALAFLEKTRWSPAALKQKKMLQRDRCWTSIT